MLLLALSGAVDAQETVTVAALGDSLTQGFGLPPEDGLVPQLEGWLSRNGYSVQMINAGVSGDTTAGGRSRLGWTLTDEVDALIVALGGNDLLRGIDPAVARENLDAILAGATEQGLPVLLVGVEAPSNYGPEYKAAFDAIYPDLAEKYDTLLFRDFFAPLEARRETEDGAMARYMQPDRTHPSAEGVAVIVEALGPKVADLVKRARDGG